MKLWKWVLLVLILLGAAAWYATSAQVYPPMRSLTTSVLIFGDSYTEGEGATRPSNGYAPLLVDEMGWHRARIIGIGGTGYTNDGRIGKDFGTRAQTLAADLDGFDPSLILVQGGLNDQRAEQAELFRAATSFAKDLQKEFPNARVILIGPTAPTAESQQAISRVSAVLASVARNENIGWIDATNAILDRTHPESLISKDRTHLNDAGYRILAEVLADELLQMGNAGFSIG